jgi:hypothetical protein
LLATGAAAAGADQALAGHITKVLSTAVLIAAVRSHWGDADEIRLGLQKFVGYTGMARSQKGLKKAGFQRSYPLNGVFCGFQISLVSATGRG